MVGFTAPGRHNYLSLAPRILGEEEAQRRLVRLKRRIRLFDVADLPSEFGGVVEDFPLYEGRGGVSSRGMSSGPWRRRRVYIYTHIVGLRESSWLGADGVA